jgi:hypothetical protein
MQPQSTRVEGASIVMESFELTSPVTRHDYQDLGARPIMYAHLDILLEAN